MLVAVGPHAAIVLRSPRARRATLATAGLLVLVMLAGTPSQGDATPAGAGTTAATTSCGPQPKAATEPSGAPPLAPRLFFGWTRVYCTDFFGTQLPPGWTRFSGIPKGDPEGRWSPSHVRVGGGVLDLSTSRDPSLKDQWVSGGVCLCGLPRRYGAYFVRSRLTGGGASDVELLWPKNNSWPPEVDFFESWQFPFLNTFTDHYGRVDHKIQGWLKANLTRWHTWGVIWTPGRLEFVVDWGVDTWSVWGTVTRRSAVPSLPMTLDLQQQVWCSLAPACPARPASLLVDWVTVFAPSTKTPDAHRR